MDGEQNNTSEFMTNRWIILTVIDNEEMGLWGIKSILSAQG
jgi:hypothetical protein